MYDISIVSMLDNRNVPAGSGFDTLHNVGSVRCVYESGVLFVLFNLLFDILQTVSDPRLRKED